MPPPALIHHQIPPFLLPNGDAWRARLWVPAALDVTDGWLRTEPDNEERLTPLHEIGRHGPHRLLEASLTPDPASELTTYSFKLLCGSSQWWLDAAGIGVRMPLRERCFRLARQTPPAWVPDQVFYQIFPERFRNGDPGLSPTDGAFAQRDEGPIRAKRWGAPIDPLRPNGEFYGGDLVGVRHALDYLADLGVTGIYLNPIFTSPSVHKYDCEDFEHVDPHLGGDQALADLREAMTERGMRLLLDAVFNHCSDTHPWFNRWGTHPAPGAYQSPTAPWREAFIFHAADDPDSYYCWMGSRVLPVLDFSSQRVRDYFYAGADAIARRWLRPPYAIDGWRFDVIHMLGDGPGAANNSAHVRGLRAAIKDERADAYILGEHFFDASPWLQGDQEDGAMNYYGLAHPLRAFLARQDVNYHPISIDAAELNAWLTDARSRIPYANQLCQLNLLGSHDTTRFLTLLDGDKALLRMALAVQFCWPGVPCVYYGDEIGMTGANDPFNRACFDWDEAHWDQSLRNFIKTLAGLRQNHPALRRGACKTLYAAGDAFAFARFDASEQLLAAINRGTQAIDLVPDLTALPSAADGWTNLLDNELSVGADPGRLTVPPKGLLLLHRHAAIG